MPDVSDPRTLQGPSRRVVLGSAVAAIAGIASAPLLAATSASAAPALVSPQPADGPGNAPQSHFGPHAAIAVSPNQRIAIGLWTEGDAIRWSVLQDNAIVVEPSAAGFVLGDGTAIGSTVSRGRTTSRQSTGSWQPVYGRNATVSDAYQETRVSFTAASPAGTVAFDVVIRAYDYGAALRYEITNAPGGTITLGGELTSFALPSGSVVYGSRDEDPFVLARPGAIPTSGGGSTDGGPVVDNPVTALLPGGALVCVGESARLHYPRLMLASGSGNALVAYLMQHAGRSGSSTPATTFTLSTPAVTPWRALVLGADAAELADHADLIVTLAPPSAIGDTSWIKPGKAIRVTSLTTQAGLDGVDFAVRAGLSYIEFDAGWYGPENSASSDPTAPIAALNLAQVLAYAKAANVGVILYVNRIALSDPDSLFALYEQWGVAGLKLGFILDGTQDQTDQVVNFAAVAAEHHLLLNQHDDLRPFGQERTYPNWINMEGVRGNEHFPTASHNVVLPFSRNITGPMDYTICVRQSRDLTTPMHQAAMSIVYYQPLEWVYWYSTPAQISPSWPELPLLTAVPSVWDESRALAGGIGQYAVIARRSGDTWYVGAMNNEQQRVIEVPLRFLGGGSWTATVYADGAPNDTPNNTTVVVSTKTVDSTASLAMRLAPCGGGAIVLTRS